MFHLHSDKNKFGYYTVGDYNTYSKLDAHQVSIKSNNPVQWVFNDSVFKSIDWTIDPPGTLWDYYTQRAQQIRNNYDYVVLMFSGGADSTNILNSFVKNNIHIDEIAQFAHSDGAGKNAQQDREVWKVAAPKSQEIVANYIHTKHRIVDVSEMYSKEYLNKDTKFDFIFQSNNYLLPLNIVRANLRDYVDDWKHIIDSGKRLCLVWGCEKPRVFLDKYTNKHAFRFDDHVEHCVGVKTQQMNNPGWFDEFFYWTPDLPLLPIKQAHTIKNFFRNPDYSLGLIHNNNSPTENMLRIPRSDTDFRSGTTIIDGQRWFLKREGLHYLIYPHWDPNTFTDGKPPSIVLHPRDHWFWGDSSANTASKNYHQGIAQFAQLLPKSEWIDPSNFLMGVKPIVSTLSYLE
jgi:hypothetical protein